MIGLIEKWSSQLHGVTGLRDYVLKQHPSWHPVASVVPPLELSVLWLAHDRLAPLDFILEGQLPGHDINQSHLFKTTLDVFVDYYAEDSGEVSIEGRSDACKLRALKWFHTHAQLPEQTLLFSKCNADLSNVEDWTEDVLREFESVGTYFVDVEVHPELPRLPWLGLYFYETSSFEVCWHGGNTWCFQSLILLFEVLFQIGVDDSARLMLCGASNRSTALEHFAKFYDRYMVMRTIWASMGSL